MDNLFEELEIIVQHALLNQTTTGGNGGATTKQTPCRRTA
jgi:hypothetical protein